MVGCTDCLDMTIAVDWDVKPQTNDWETNKTDSLRSQHCNHKDFEMGQYVQCSSQCVKEEINMKININQKLLAKIYILTSRRSRRSKQF